MFTILLLATVAAAPCRDVAPSDPVWEAIGQQYTRIADAQREKNIDLLAAIYAPDMQVIDRGKVSTREDSLRYSRAAFRVVQRELHTSNTILSLRLCGDKAPATVLQQWSRMQLVDGKARRVDTAAVQDETWIRSGGAWKRWRIENVHPGAWFVDDERVR